MLQCPTLYILTTNSNFVKILGRAGRPKHVRPQTHASHTDPLGCVSYERQEVLATVPVGVMPPPIARGPCCMLVNAWAAPTLSVDTPLTVGPDAAADPGLVPPDLVRGATGTRLGLGACSQGAAGNAQLGVSVHRTEFLTSACLPAPQMRPLWR